MQTGHTAPYGWGQWGVAGCPRGISKRARNQQSSLAKVCPGCQGPEQVSINGFVACSYACYMTCWHLSSKHTSQPILLVFATVTDPCRGIGDFQHNFSTCTYGMQVLDRLTMCNRMLLPMGVAGRVVVYYDSIITFLVWQDFRSPAGASADPAAKDAV